MTETVWRVVTSGKSREELVAGAAARGRRVYWDAEAMMSRPQFVTTTDVTYRLVVIRGEEIANELQRTCSFVRDVAASRGYGTPPAEVALLLAQYSRDELGYDYIVVMHEPLSSREGYPKLLQIQRYSDGEDSLDAVGGLSESMYKREYVFVFLAPQDAA